MHGFHAGGMDCYLAALKRQRDEQVAALRERLARAATAEAVAEIVAVIRMAESEHAQKAAAARYSLF